LPEKELRSLAVHRIRIQVKTLAAQQRFARHEMRKIKDPGLRDILLWRTRPIRKAARMAQLASAFLRGKKYRETENNSRERVSVFCLRQQINNCLIHTMYVTEKDVEKWLNE